MFAYYLGSLQEMYSHATLRRCYHVYSQETHHQAPHCDVLDFLWPLEFRMNDIDAASFIVLYQAHHKIMEHNAFLFANIPRVMAMQQKNTFDYFFIPEGLNAEYPFHAGLIHVIHEELKDFFNAMKYHEKRLKK